MAESTWMMAVKREKTDVPQYRAYRLRNLDKGDVTANRRYYGIWSPDRAAVKILVEMLNGGEIQP